MFVISGHAQCAGFRGYGTECDRSVETIRFIKQRCQLEDIRLLKYQGSRTLTGEPVPMPES